MISKIFASGSTIKERVRRSILYVSRKSGADSAWKKRHHSVFAKHPGYDDELSNMCEEKHRARWKPFRHMIPMETVRICGAISGLETPDMVPEEIFQADIEPTLNTCHEAHYLADKRFYTRWLPDAGFPVCLLHKVNGEVLDHTYTTLFGDKLAKYINSMKYPVILKPATGSYGGSGVQFIQSASELTEVVLQEDNVVVQEVVRQSPRTEAFHPQSLNTVRVYLYRSVHDNRIYIINRAFRTGNGSRVDNVASGGLVTFLHGTGDLNGFALDRYGGRFETHPVTGKPFSGQLPNIEQLDTLAKEVAHKLFRLRVVGLDLYCDNNDQWNMLEINTKGHSIRFSQYHGYPFFGEFTDEVIEYCKENHWALNV
jgi:SOS response regulatory protein OraA/RecX